MQIGKDASKFATLSFYRIATSSRMNINFNFLSASFELRPHEIQLTPKTEITAFVHHANKLLVS